MNNSFTCSAVKSPFWYRCNTFCVLASIGIPSILIVAATFLRHVLSISSLVTLCGRFISKGIPCVKMIYFRSILNTVERFVPRRLRISAAWRLSSSVALNCIKVEPAISSPPSFSLYHIVMIMCGEFVYHPIGVEISTFSSIYWSSLWTVISFISFAQKRV